MTIIDTSEYISAKIIVKEIKPSEEVFEEKPEEIEKEGMDVSGITEILEPKDTQITLPKNRLEQIFDQYFTCSWEERKIQHFLCTEGKKPQGGGHLFSVERGKICFLS